MKNCKSEANITKRAVVLDVTPDTATKQLAIKEEAKETTILNLQLVKDGEKVFKKCKACHSITADGENKIGPKLWNVMFRPVGLIDDYKYSKALVSYGKEWNWEEMNGFLTKPSKWIKGNKMGFGGLKDEKDRASVILYLNQNSNNPKPLP